MKRTLSCLSILLALTGFGTLEAGPSRTATGRAERVPQPPIRGNTGFDPKVDGFGFPNDTVREYLPDAQGRIVGQKRREGDEPDFAHACFLISRATIQFFKFVRFDPDAPKLSQDALFRRLKKLFRIHAWASPHREKIVIPGYRNLAEFTRENKAMLQATLGSWRMTYIRVGNYRMTWPFPRAGQELAKKRIIRELEKGRLQAVYLARFPRMNHCVIIYAYKEYPNGSIEFLTYDPNYPGKPTWLRYHAATRSFELQKRWYYNEGWVNVMRVYISPVH